MNNFHALSIPKPKCLFSNLDVPNIKLLGPGPTNMTRKVKKSLENPMLGPMDATFFKVMDDIKEGLQYIFQTSSPYVFCIPGVGHAGLEATISSLLEPDEVFLVGINGIWGERAAEIGIRQGLKVELMKKPPGEVFEKDHIKASLEIYKPTALFLTQVESSSCVLQNLENIGHLCHRYGTFLIVDVVASVVATPLFMDKWGIDVAFTGTQKALGGPPGLAPIAVSRNAMNKVKARKSKPTTYYLDFLPIANYWNCDAEERRYHHTCPVHTAYALRESLSDVVIKGLEWYWERQIQVRDTFINGIERLGYKLFVTRKEIRAPTITAIVVPAGVEWRKVTRQIHEQYQIQILGGLGPTTGQIFRIGFMGSNCEESIAQIMIDAFHSTIQEHSKL